MALTTENLTEEQKQKIKKANKKFLASAVAIGVLYGVFLVFANLSIALINEFYVHSQQFLFLASFGTALITFRGMFNTAEERRAVLAKEIAAIAPKSE